MSQTPTCSHCGSTDVVIDAWANWNDETQEWELFDTFDEAFCRACEGGAQLKWVKE